MNIASQILKHKNEDQTVFTTAEISQLCSIKNPIYLYSALIYATNKRDLIRIARGIYALSEKYSRKQLANKYRSPSYISLYTTLIEEGVVFQYYSSIFVITNRSEETTIDKQKYIYRKIKNEILLNPLGIVNKQGISQATKERAICDKIYLDGDEYFDNLSEINWQMMKKLNNELYNNSNIRKFILKNEGEDK